MSNYRISSEERNKYEQGLAQGTGRGGTGLLDTFGLTEGLFGTGGKGKAMEQILTDPSTKYTPGQGYNLNWWQRNIDKITDQDVANARINREREALVSKYGDKAEQYGIGITGTTSRVELADQIKEAEKVEELTGTLRRMSNGNAALAKLQAGDAPITASALEGAIADTNEYNTYHNPTAVLQRDTQKLSNDIARSAEERAGRNETLTLEIHRENNRNRWDDKREARIADQEARIMNSENQMANLALEKFRINENNQLRRDEFEYKKQLDQRQRSQDIANGFMSLVAAFAL